MTTKYLQSRLTLKEARHFFDYGYVEKTGVVVTCQAYNSTGLQFHDHSILVLNYGNARMTGRKVRMYMDAMRKVLGKVPDSQRFMFNITPDMAQQANPGDYGWLLEIMNEFNGSLPKPRVNLGILQWSCENTVAALAQLAFRDKADAMRFKLAYC